MFNMSFEVKLEDMRKKSTLFFWLLQRVRLCTLVPVDDTKTKGLKTNCLIQTARLNTLWNNILSRREASTKSFDLEKEESELRNARAASMEKAVRSIIHFRNTYPSQHSVNPKARWPWQNDLIITINPDSQSLHRKIYIPAVNGLTEYNNNNNNNNNKERQEQHCTIKHPIATQWFCPLQYKPGISFWGGGKITPCVLKMPW